MTARPTTRLAYLFGATILGLLLALAGAVGTASAAACGAPTKTWSGPPNGDWFTAANWTPAGVPTAADDVCIGAGASVVIGGTASANTLESSGTVTLRAGTLSLAGAGQFNSGSTLLWSGISTMTGTGTTTIAAGGTLTINDAFIAGDHFLRGGRTLTLNGTGSWSGLDNLRMGEGAAFNIAGTFTITNDQDSDWFTGAQPTLHVLAGGTLKKSAGSGQSRFGAALENDGLVQADTGALELAGLFSGVPATSSGNWKATNAGAGIGLGNLGGFSPSDFVLDGGHVLAGGGVVSVDRGITNINGAGLIVDTGATFGMHGGTTGGSGPLTVNGGYLWKGISTMTGTGTTTIAAGGTLTINDAFSAGDRTLSGGRTLNLNGTGSWSGLDNLRMGEGAAFNIAGTFTATNNQDAFWFGGAQPTLHVLAGGVLKKTTGSGVSRFGALATNDGTVRGESGILDLNGGLTNFNSGTNTLTGGAYVVSGGSTLRFPNANIVTNAASITLAGNGSQILDEASQNALRNLATNAAGSKLILLPALTVPGAFTNNGLLSIGDNNDSFTTTTTYTQTSTGTLGITVGGTTPGVNLGHLQAGGAATLAGTLALTTNPAFTPVEGQTFTIANYASKSGKFKTITGRQIPGSPLAYKVTVGATSIMLQALQSADLRLTGTAPASVLHGTNYDYTWTIDNLGPGTAKNVVLTDTLPVGVTFVSASPGCTAVGQKVTCKPANMANGATVSFTITVTAPATPGMVRNTASVTTKSVDLVATNNKKTLTTTVT